MKNIAQSASRQEYGWLEDDAWDLYESAADESTTITGTDGVHRKLISDLSKIEEFVESVITTEDLAFCLKTDRGGIVKLHKNRLAKYFSSFNGIYEGLSKDYHYSAKVKLFIQCYLEFGYSSLWFEDPKKGTPSKGKLNWEIFNEFVSLIRTKTSDKNFKNSEKRQKNKVEQRLKNASFYVDRLFRNRNKLLVLRIDFSYRKDVLHETTPELAKKDLKKFLNNKRCNRSLFEHYDGYIWKFEYGPDKGYHFHMILFFNGDKIQSDSHWAMKIGEYWKNVITRGRGIYFNCNAYKHKYTHLGIGKIPRNNEQLVGNLKSYVIGYLAKTEQYLKAKSFGRERCWDMGGEKRKRSNADRPVKSAKPSY